MRLLKAILSRLRSWFSFWKKISRAAQSSVLESTHTVVDDKSRNSANKINDEQILHSLEEGTIVNTIENQNLVSTRELTESEPLDLQGDFVTLDEIVSIDEELEHAMPESIKKPPRLSTVPNYSKEITRNVHHEELTLKDYSYHRTELVFDSRNLIVFLKISLSKDLLEDNLHAQEELVVKIDSTRLGLELNKAQNEIVEERSFIVHKTIVDKAFKAITVDASEAFGLARVSLSSIRRELYIFKDTNSGECPYKSTFDNGLSPNALLPGYYWFLYRNDVKLLGPRIEFYDNRLIWDDYSVVRAEITEDTETIIAHKNGEIIFRLPPYEGYKIEGECILDDDPQRPILIGKARIKAPSTATGKVVVWLRSQTYDVKSSSDWDLEKERVFSICDNFSIPLGFIQIDIVESDGTIYTKFFRWLPFLDNVRYQRGIILPINGDHSNVSISIKKNSDDIEIFAKNAEIIYISEHSVNILLPANIDNAVIQFSYNSEKSGEIICKLKRFRWAVEYKDIRLSENDPNLMIERSQLDYTAPIKIILPEWLTSLPQEQSLVLMNNQGTIMKEPLRLKKGDSKFELGVFLDTINTNLGRLYLKWTYFSDAGKYEQILLSIKPSICTCRICGMKISGDECHNHILEYHFESCYVQLDYQSIRQRYMPELPEKIYVCTLCGHYVKSSSLDTSAITQMKHHFIAEHPFKNESFSVSTDVDEIREKYEKNLPYVFICKYCGKEIIVNPENKKRLLSEHAGIHPEIVNEIFDMENT